MMHLLAILWKNGIIRIFRHKTLLVFLLLLPALLFFFIAYARSKLNGFGKDYINETTYGELIPANYLYNNFGGNNKLVYVPKTKFTDNLIREVQLQFEIPNSDVEGLRTEDDLLKFYNKNKDDSILLGVVFQDVEDFPKALKYNLRTYDKDIDYKTSKLFHSQIQYTNGIGSERYIHRSLLALQLAIDQAYIKLAKRNSNIDGRQMPQIMFQEFPYPPYLNDYGLNELFIHVLPLATLFSFILICPDLLKRLVEEKSTGIKELMKMMGMSTVFQWTGWFVSSFLMSLVSIIFIVILMKAPIWHDNYAPIEYCSWSIYATFLTLYCSASISKCFLLSTFFHKPSIVIVFGIFLWLLSYIIPISLTNEETASFFSKMFLMLLPNMGLYYGYKAIAVFELREIGMQWSTVTAATDGGDNDIKMLHVFIMLIVDVFFYFILALYLDTVNPGPYGIKKPFTFPLTYILSLFKCKNMNVGMSHDDKSNSTDEIKKILEETYVDNSRVGIRVENLRKVYNNNVLAVNHLNVKFLKGEITALLGHNGAGKTTTLSIITGIINRTSGRVIINDNDISDNISVARRSMGICTQHNLYFQDLTVMEHLTFFGMVKGQTYCVAKTNARKLLNELHLEEKQNALPMTLSGGMQRKLCLAIALCGNPEILILDEPTSGMDVQTRRFIWDKLLERRRANPDCTTIVSTHFMEEAEVIGDRIAIMQRGVLSCYGSLPYLKHTFDTGYRLKLTFLQPETPYMDNMDEVDSIVVSHSNKELRSRLTEIINAFHSVVEVVKRNDNMIECKMPIEREDRKQFLNFLHELELNKDRLNIETINITNISLEDIYLKHLSTEKVDADNADGTIIEIPSRNTEYSTTSTKKSKIPNTKVPMRNSRVQIGKRWNVFMNTKFTTLKQCLPSLLLIIILMVLMIKSDSSKEVKFKIFNYDLRPYGKTTAYYGYNSNELKPLASYYNDVVKQEGSISTHAESVSNAIVDVGKENIVYYKRHMVVGAEFNMTTDSRSPKVNVMYSNTALHGAPISLNLITNSLIKWMIGPEYSIKAANFPLPGHATTTADVMADAQQLILFILLFPIAIFTFLCTFLSTPWQDVSSHMKHLQHMSGLTEKCYWLSLWIFDMIVCGIVFAAIVFVLMGALFGATGLVQWMSYGPAMGILFCILMTYAVAALPLAYIMSHMGSMPAAVNAFLITGLFSGFVPTIIIYVMEESNDPPYVEAAGYMSKIFSLWPQFGLCYACLKFMLKTLWIFKWDIKTEAAKKITCYYDYNPCCGDDNAYECSKYKTYLIGNDTAFGDTLGIMLISAVIYFLILIHHKKVIDNIFDCFKKCTREVKPNNSGPSLKPTQLLPTNKSKSHYIVNDVCKDFNKKKAVNRLSFNVADNSLFGILGVNGAGKSTTFKVLAGIEKPTGGNATIVVGEKQYTLDNGLEYTKRLGYCPQEDCLMETLTGRQILNLFAGLRGVPKDTVNQIIKQIGIEEHADKCCGLYSGGTKRKLCLAISVLGNLPILLLDEPTTGVDPKSKRDIWELLILLRKNSSIVLTSHSMDECEALSDRLLIMKAGESKAENTIPLLKEEYGHMYKLVLKTNPKFSEVDTKMKVENVFKDRFGVSAYSLFDHHGNTYNYHIQKKSVLLSIVFIVMEDLLQQCLIREYTVHEPTLEDVFLEIAKPTAEPELTSIKTVSN